MEFTERPKIKKRDIIIAIVTTIMAIIVIILLLSIKDTSDLYNGKKVIKAEVIDPSNEYDLVNFEYQNIEIKLTLADNTEATINLKNSMLDENSLIFLDNIPRKISHHTMYINCYKQKINYQTLFYFTPTIDDVYEEDNISYIDYGIYPQELLADRKLVNKLDQIRLANLENGIDNDYVDYLGVRYVRKQAVSRNNLNYTFKNGEVIIHDVDVTQKMYQDDKKSFDKKDYANCRSWSLQEKKDEEKIFTNFAEFDVYYYFIMSPIKWQVLLEDNNKLHLLSNDIIDYGDYAFLNHPTDNDDYIYDYEESELRKSLLNSFPTMFPGSTSQFVLTETVDNQTFGFEETESINCANTFDPIYALSVTELSDAPFKGGYKVIAGTVTIDEDDRRAALYSDFSRLFCLEMNDDGVGKYWTRTPCQNVLDALNYADWTYYVDYDGTIRTTQYGLPRGMRPGIKLKIS